MDEAIKDIVAIFLEAMELTDTEYNRFIELLRENEQVQDRTIEYLFTVRELAAAGEIN